MSCPNCVLADKAISALRAQVRRLKKAKQPKVKFNRFNPFRTRGLQEETARFTTLRPMGGPWRGELSLAGGRGTYTIRRNTVVMDTNRLLRVAEDINGEPVWSMGYDYTMAARPETLTQGVRQGAFGVVHYGLVDTPWGGSVYQYTGTRWVFVCDFPTREVHLPAVR